MSGASGHLTADGVPFVPGMPLHDPSGRRHDTGGWTVGTGYGGRAVSFHGDLRGIAADFAYASRAAALLRGLEMARANLAADAERAQASWREARRAESEYLAALEMERGS